MGRRLVLITNAPNEETVKALQGLLEDARRGSVIGVAYIAIHRGADYSGDVVGRARGFPAYCLGLIRLLEAQIISSIR